MRWTHNGPLSMSPHEMWLQPKLPDRTEAICERFLSFALRRVETASRMRPLPERKRGPASNVDILTEMIAVMNASRAYESDAALFDTGKTLAEKTIDMGRL